MPKGLQTLRLAFQETHLTHFGGMVLLQRFCNKLGLRRGLQRSIRLLRRNANYLHSDLILALLYSIMAGRRRMVLPAKLTKEGSKNIAAAGLPLPERVHQRGAEDRKSVV